MSLSTRNYRHAILGAAFFFSLHQGIVAYIGSSFIAQEGGAASVGLVYALAAACAIIATFTTPHLLRHYSLQRVTKLSVLATLISLLGLTIPLPWWSTLIFFVAVYILGILVRFLLDIYLEAKSDDEHTGRIRGLYLTVANSAWVIAPLIAGSFATHNLHTVYVVAAICTLPVLYIVNRYLKSSHLTRPRDLSLGTALYKLFHARRGMYTHIAKALSIDFVLNFFYAIMVIYLPLLLLQSGFSWVSIGIILTIMLTPFALVQYPLGLYADTRIGEKEVMVCGLILMALSSMTLAFLSGAPLIVWAGVLFMSRVGAASLEITKESYLFKHIDSSDTLIMSISRNAMPFSYLLAPLCASLFLLVWPLPYLFVGLALTLLPGVLIALNLADTR